MPSIVVSVGGSTPTVLLPGDLIGRSPTAALCLDDPRISEVHAYVSLRGGELFLLGLRGRLGVDGQVVRKLALRAGTRVDLARDLTLHIEQVALPDRVLAIEGDGLPRQALEGTCSLVFDPEPSLQPGAVPGASLQLWTHQGVWRCRPRGGTAAEVTPGQTWTLEERTFRAAWVPVSTSGATPTASVGRLRPPLVVRARYDSVTFERDDEIALVLSGRNAQLMSELIAFDGPVRWETLAGEIWGRDADPRSHRPKLDVTLGRLRRQLAAVGLPRDLVRSDGSGHLELVLEPRDRVIAEL